jgi:hypothetical protein
MAHGMAAYGTPVFLPLADSPMISPSLENGNPDSPEPGFRGQAGGNRPAPVGENESLFPPQKFAYTKHSKRPLQICP